MGMFISLVFSIPLLFNAMIIVVSLNRCLKMLTYWSVYFFFFFQSKQQLIHLCLLLTDGVGVPDIFYHDWTENSSAEEKGPATEKTEGRLNFRIFLLLFYVFEKEECSFLYLGLEKLFSAFSQLLENSAAIWERDPFGVIFVPLFQT